MNIEQAASVGITIGLFRTTITTHCVFNCSGYWVIKKVELITLGLLTRALIMFWFETFLER